jgi:hypothetical protein
VSTLDYKAFFPAKFRRLKRVLLSFVPGRIIDRALFLHELIQWPGGSSVSSHPIGEQIGAIWVLDVFGGNENNPNAIAVP